MSDTHRTETVQFTTLTYGGDCMGRLADGRAIFTPFVLPGETARVEIVEEKKNYARGRLVEVITPSARRIAPRCRHFAVCGGCHYQHMDYPSQLEAKREILVDQLTRIAGIPDPPVEAVVPSSQPWYYRNAVQFHLDPQGKVGFQEAGSHRVVAIRECFLPEAPLNSLWPQLDFEPLGGDERVELRVGAGEEELMVLESQAAASPEFSVDLPLSAVFSGPDGQIILAGDDYLVMEVLGRPFKVSAGSFFQVNTLQAAAMVEHLLSALHLTPETTLLDLYCGVGLFSAFLASRVRRCIGVELSTSACDDYAANLDEFDNVELYVGAVEEVLPELEVAAGVVVLDPPRAGLDRHALDALVAMGPGQIAYVSCDPSTLARDLKRLAAAGYRVERVTPFDLFPQTYHIESVVLLAAGK